jgi:hypothetical protein
MPCERRFKRFASFVRACLRPSAHAVNWLRPNHGSMRPNHGSMSYRNWMTSTRVAPGERCVEPTRRSAWRRCVLCGVVVGRDRLVGSSRVDDQALRKRNSTMSENLFQPPRQPDSHDNADSSVQFAGFGLRFAAYLMDVVAVDPASYDQTRGRNRE